MNTFKGSLMILIIFMLPKVLLFGQKNSTVEMPVIISIPAIALLNFAGSDKGLTYIQGKGAEQIITPSTLDKTWINYSSIVDGNSTNTISVNISSGNLPVEVVVKLNVGKDNGAGGGSVGQPTGQVTLSQYPQAIITDIGSCFTGQGIQKGHQLTYSWEWMPPYEYNPSIIENFEIAVMYTLTAGK